MNNANCLNIGHFRNCYEMVTFMSEKYFLAIMLRIFKKLIKNLIFQHKCLVKVSIDNHCHKLKNNHILLLPKVNMKDTF